MKLVEIAKAVADENRMRIINILSKDELCVCNINEILELTQSNTSRHLNKLKKSGIIKSKKSAQWVYYSLNKEVFNRYSFLKGLLKDLEEEEKWKEDLKRLEKELGCKITDNKKECNKNE